MKIEQQQTEQKPRLNRTERFLGLLTFSVFCSYFLFDCCPIFVLCYSAISFVASLLLFLYTKITKSLQVNFRYYMQLWCFCSLPWAILCLSYFMLKDLPA